MADYRQSPNQRSGQGQGGGRGPGQGQYGGRVQEQDPQVAVFKKRLEEFKTQGLSKLPAEELVHMANKMGEILRNSNLKVTQIRRFLDGVRKIDSQSQRGKSFNPELVILLKPKLAYAVGRETKIKPLMEVLDPAISAGSKGYDDFKKLLAMIEGIVAYHKFYGGQD